MVLLSHFALCKERHVVVKTTNNSQLSCQRYSVPETLSQLLPQYLAPNSPQHFMLQRHQPPVLLDVNLAGRAVKLLFTTAPFATVLSKPLHAWQPMAPLGTGNVIWISKWRSSMTIFMTVAILGQQVAASALLAAEAHCLPLRLSTLTAHRRE